MAPRERGRNQALCYGKCWSKLLLTKRKFWFIFSYSCDIKSEISYIICSYLRRLLIQNLLKCTGTLQIFINPLPNPVRIFYLKLWSIYRMFIWRQTVLDLPIDSIGWSLGPQNYGGLRPRCIIFLTLLLDFHTYAVIT
jgi:hypothetical protein